jgi:uncharacterized protein (DUF3084 family)
MTTGYILIAIILLMGGTIASVGERLEKRVRKHRLSLFRLRPKYTILLIAFFTGVAISALTVIVLFVFDNGLQNAIFQLEAIRKDIQNSQEQLHQINQQLQNSGKS